MATSRTTKKTDDIEVIDQATTDQDKPVGEIHEGIYIERDVELTNGVKIDIEVITDKKKLPLTMGLHLSEGNIGAVLCGQLTSNTLRMMDFVGATQEDLSEVVGPVIQRAQKLSKDD